MKIISYVLALAAMAALSCQAHTSSATAKVMRLATLEWPPYNGQLLPQDGLSTRVATVVAKSAGYRLMSASSDWATTVERGEKDPNYEGFCSQRVWVKIRWKTRVRLQCNSTPETVSSVSHPNISTDVPR